MASGGCSLGLDGLETAEGIDMSTLVTALESLLNLAAKQHVQVRWTLNLLLRTMYLHNMFQPRI